MEVRGVSVRAAPSRPALRGLALRAIRFLTKPLELQLALSEAQLAAIFEATDVAIGMLDEWGGFVRVTPAFARLAGSTRGLTDAIRVRADSLAAQRRTSSRCELKLTANGDAGERWIRITLAGVYEATACRFVVATIADVTDEKSREARRLYDATHDALTGLANRGALLDVLDAACTGEWEPFALFFIDLDRFKPVNDAFGHATGDAVLAAVAGRLRHAFGPDDVVARLGGDEFAVVVRGIDDRDAAIAIARRLCEAVESPYAVPEHVVGLSASVGILVASESERNRDRLIARADAAMYRAKVLGLRYAISSESDAPGAEKRSRTFPQVSEFLADN